MMKSLLSGLAMVAVTAGMSFAGHHEDASADAPMMIGEATSNAPTLEQVLAGDHRSDKNKARDAFRNPAATLNFLGLQPDMKVAEIWPGGGWYMEVIAPYVAAKGQYIAVGFDLSSESAYVKRATEGLKNRVTENPELYGVVTITELADGKYDIAPAGSMDMVITFRNVHNWMNGDGMESKVFAAMYKALKPGGVLGVVEHRAAPGAEIDPKAASGYVDQDLVIKLAEESGFQLVDTSEINANAADTKDHPKGVWTLPPSLRNGDEDRAKYEAIGESDRMTLKFVKPAIGGMAFLN